MGNFQCAEAWDDSLIVTHFCVLHFYQIRDLDLDLRYVMNTHVHADHVTGTGNLKKLFGSACKSVISEAAGARADLLIRHGDLIKLGDIQIECRSTPGSVLNLL